MEEKEIEEIKSYLAKIDEIDDELCKIEKKIAELRFDLRRAGDFLNKFIGTTEFEPVTAHDR